MRIVFCWMDITGYMAACWRELAKRPEVQLHVVAFQPRAAQLAPFDTRIMEGVSCDLLDADQRGRADYVRQVVAARDPDVIAVSGWSHRPYTRLLGDKSLTRARFVLNADTPARYDWRQRLAKVKIGAFLKRVDAVAVPGERGFQVMRYWGVPEAKIMQGLYGADCTGLAPLLSKRLARPGGWPRQFLFIGRYVPVKGVDLLIKAYTDYRRQVSEPWPLVMCGTGPMAQQLQGVAGVEDRGFVQPEDLSAVIEQAGAFVLPSRLDPWGVVIAETGAAGLPVVCTRSCGASAELVRSYHNGLVIPAGEVGPLTQALVWMHEHYDRLPEMGRLGQQLASAFSAERWADRWTALCSELVERQCL